MIDLHCHILPHIDDGPATFEESVAMAQLAAQDGISAIVATPHVNEKMYDPVEIHRRVHYLNHLLRVRNIPISVFPGADVSVVFRPHQVHEFTINNTDYILIEFFHTHLPWNAKKIVEDFVDDGFKPIITHPERNPSIISNPNLLFDIHIDSCYVQVTAGSLAGNFGRAVQECAIHLMRAGIVDILATDAHSSTFRKPCLTEGVKVAAEIVGTEAARRLVFSTPAKIIAGLDVQRESTHVI